MPYEFTQEDFRKFTEKIIGAEGDQATLTSELTDMQSTFTEAMALVETTKTENEKIAAENDRLKQSNMSLFLRVGEQAKSKDDNRNSQQDDGDKFANADEYMQAYFDKIGGTK